MAKLTMIKAITNALDEELGRDDKVQIFGEDVGKNGGVFRATDGLQKKYGPERVYDTPLAESGIIGLANGLAMQGFRPVPEIQFMGFVFEAFDQIAGQLARERFRMGGSRNFPVTVVSILLNCTPTVLKDWLHRFLDYGWLYRVALTMQRDF